MGHRPGTGRMERQVLAALDGVAVEYRELAEQIVGGTPSRSEYNSINRAAHQLARAGMLKLTHVPRGPGGGTGPYRTLLLKTSNWLQDGDAATADDAELVHDGWLDRAWQAFATDYRYAQEMCEAATGLLTEDELELDRGRLRQLGDDDAGAADELRGLEVQDATPPIEPRA